MQVQEVLEQGVTDRIFNLVASAGNYVSELGPGAWDILADMAQAWYLGHFLAATVGFILMLAFTYKVGKFAAVAWQAAHENDWRDGGLVFRAIISLIVFAVGLGTTMAMLHGVMSWIPEATIAWFSEDAAAMLYLMEAVK